ncbi:MAG: hypothetical protein ABF649_02475 [Bacillus sp. (in: firmicutes)]
MQTNFNNVCPCEPYCGIADCPFFYPHTPIYTMSPTDLMNIMMKDSFKILEQCCLFTGGVALVI